tara:strand:+ start:6224 stop:6616 length:393 start_codon:yes stop_codon:yes gene_type:complete
MNMIANSLIGSVSKILDKFVGDKDLNVKLNHELMMAINSIDVAQTKIALQDAKSKNWFQNSWRPACAWICVFGLAWHCVIQPIIIVITSSLDITLNLPNFEIEILMPLLMGMLGLGSMRSFERSRGVDKR